MYKTLSNVRTIFGLVPWLNSLVWQTSRTKKIAELEARLFLLEGQLRAVRRAMARKSTISPASAPATPKPFGKRQSGDTR